MFQTREETDTKIDLPSENSDSDVIVITGKKANVEQTKAEIEAIRKKLVQTVLLTEKLAMQFCWCINISTVFKATM